jgi:hypothetical protein
MRDGSPMTALRHTAMFAAMLAVATAASAATAGPRRS